MCSNIIESKGLRKNVLTTAQPALLP